MLRFSVALTILINLLADPVLAREPLADYVIAEFGAPPAIPQGALKPKEHKALDELLEISVNQSAWNPHDLSSFRTIAASSDPRIVWALADMLRFAWRPEFTVALTDVAAKVIQTPADEIRLREALLNKMIAWDIPAYPSYLQHKRRVFTNYVPGWENLFVEGNVDWHLVDWGGVLIDARPYDATDEVCHCIPAADNPEVSDTAGATWLSDEDVVFGVLVNGQARAYPLRIMEVREMVNDTLGGRDIGMPYCTLCGAAQAYFTDRMPNGVERPILRTSGLLIRSNKIMYDVHTNSLFDTFTGEAVTGPLAEIGLKLAPITVITTDWGTWRETYPKTTVLVEALALGRDYNLRETRDANGPIFPIGDVDPRLSAHEDVVGVFTADGTPVAFPRAASFTALHAGQVVSFGNVRLDLSAGGLRAVDLDGNALPSHQAFWFAWSQFHPTTELWGE